MHGGPSPMDGGSFPLSHLVLLLRSVGSSECLRWLACSCVQRSRRRTRARVSRKWTERRTDRRAGRQAARKGRAPAEFGRLALINSCEFLLLNQRAHAHTDNKNKPPTASTQQTEGANLTKTPFETTFSNGCLATQDENTAERCSVDGWQETGQKQSKSTKQNSKLPALRIHANVQRREKESA